MSEYSAFPIRGAWSPVARLWWMRPWNPNPLLRPSDRLEAVLRIIATLVVLVAIPIAGALATTAYTSDAARIRTEDAAKTAVSATITAEPGQLKAHLFEAPVQWTRDGRPGTATVRVSSKASLGDQVVVWLDSDVLPTTPPHPPGVAAMTGIGVGVVVLVATWFAAWSLVKGSGWLLERHHDAQCARQWRQLNRPIREDTQ
ncbi:Rv1733c family protein [Nocardia sp. NBC_00403]|uniref:Rv1733c family protein n=1 Tax=Nocardia sp. NBC_00403 TaxID=2975990 RepID=UPI002E20AB91